MPKVLLLALAVLSAGLGLSGCGGGGAEETVLGSPPANVTAPSPPLGLTATAVSTSQINLSWSPSTVASAATPSATVAGYNVYRNAVQIASLGTVTAFQNTGLVPSTTYSYSVRARDTAGNLSAPSPAASATTQAMPDTTAPSSPTGLIATALSTSQITLSWTAATDNVGVTGYNVYRGGTLIATLGAVTAFQNTGLAASTTYTYTVRARDAAGNVSAASSLASATTLALAPDSTPPTTPTGLSAATASSSQINLAWNASTDNVSVNGYNIYRGGMLIGTVGAVTTYQSTDLAASTTYTFAVQAFDAAGNVSGQSLAASATTKAINTASLTWNASVTTNVVGYRVYFGNSPGVYFQPKGQGVDATNVTAYTVTGLNLGTRYYFTATAYDTQGNESGYGNEVFKDIP